MTNSDKKILSVVATMTTIAISLSFYLKTSGQWMASYFFGSGRYERLMEAKKINQLWGESWIFDLARTLHDITGLSVNLNGLFIYLAYLFLAFAFCLFIAYIIKFNVQKKYFAMVFFGFFLIEDVGQYIAQTKIDYLIVDILTFYLVIAICFGVLLFTGVFQFSYTSK